MPPQAPGYPPPQGASPAPGSPVPPGPQGAAPLPPPGDATTASRSSCLVPVAILLVLLIAAIGAFSWWAAHLPAASRRAASAAAAGQRGIPLEPVPGTDPGVGDSAAGGQGEGVDGIACGGTEQLISHRHAHLYILKDGASQPVSQYIGVPGAPSNTQCYYWLHTHDRSGIIHIESPDSRAYTLGEFFDIWGQPLSNSRVARFHVDSKGLTIYVDGSRYRGDPRQVRLEQHTSVVLEIGRTVPPPAYDLTGF
jgi:hypothetical protein